MFKIFCKPEHENDFYAVKFFDVNISPGQITHRLENDAYFRFKFEKFKSQDISKDGAKDFKDRPSFQDIHKVEDLAGSVYTQTIEDRNNISYQNMLQEVTMALNEIPHSRRLLVRFSNPIDEYIATELCDHLPSDLTCLAYIHYLKKRVTISFRANDIKNEMFYDFVLIYWFFIKPIYGDTPVNIILNASTSQNVASFQEVIQTINQLYCQREEA